MRRIVSALLLSCVVAIGAGVLGLWSTAPPASASTTVPPTVTPSTWTAVNTPTSSQPETLSLNGVACPTSSFCVAVGRQGFPPSPLLEQGNGSSWAPVSGPEPDGPAVLQGVSCAGPSFCVAVGSTEGSTPTTLVEQWNGSAWSIVAASALPAGTQSAQFNGVTCLSSTFCVAVGTITIAGFDPSTLNEFWDGTSWTTIHPGADTPSTTVSSQFSSVSCVSPSFCLAVGQQGPSPTPSPLAQEWNGNAWSVVTAATGPGTLGNWFSSVSCAGVSFCALVGGSDTPGSGPPTTTFIETWNGRSLALTPSPNASSTFSTLNGVACISQTSCSAVGNAGIPVQASLALTWNGTSWSLVASPNGPGSSPAALGGVTCLTNWQCIAVGQYTTDAALSEGQPFVMSAPISRTGYRFVASDGGVFNYGAGAPFLGSMGGQPLNKPIVGMAVMPAGDGYYLVASDGGIFNYGSAQFYGSTGSLHLNAPIVGMAVTADGAGYWLVASDGGIFSYGDAQFYGSTGSLKLNKPIVGMAATPDAKGYYLVASDGGIFNYGDAAFSGSAGSLTLNKPVVGMAVPSAGGYYLVASDGGIFTYPANGGPPFYGSTGSLKLNKPIVGMTAVQGGYYLSGSDGGVFTYPTSNGPTFYGSTGSIVLNQPIVGIAG